MSNRVHAIETVRHSSRNVKRWQSGERAVRWTAVGMLQVEQQFRRIIGYQDLVKLTFAVERELNTPAITHTAEQAATLTTI